MCFVETGFLGIHTTCYLFAVLVTHSYYNVDSCLYFGDF